MKTLFRISAVLIAAILTMAASPYRDMPYRDMKGRQIASLSAERIEALRNGGGAGYALPAELNGYPGPRHVLDLADRLDLTADQRQATARLFDSMRAEAVPLGEELIEKEAALDALFCGGRADETALFDLTAAAGAVEARLRATHLKYHLRMAKLLSPHQRTLYGRLRGYGDGSHGRQAH